MVQKVYDLAFLKMENDIHWCKINNNYECWDNNINFRISIGTLGTPVRILK